MRLLEWKGRVDLLLYVSRGAPELRLDEVTKYKPSRDWNGVFSEVIANAQEDGHASKLVRALAHGEEVCRPYETQAKEKGLLITGDMWLKIGNMGTSPPAPDFLKYDLLTVIVADSISDPNVPMFVRSAGFDEAWTHFRDRARL